MMPRKRASRRVRRKPTGPRLFPSFGETFVAVQLAREAGDVMRDRVLSLVSMLEKGFLPLGDDPGRR